MKIWGKNDDREMGIGETLIRIEIDHTHLPFLTLVPFFYLLFCFLLSGHTTLPLSS